MLKNISKISIITAAIFVFISQYLYANELKENKKKITILNFQAINVDESFAIRCRNLLEVELFQLKEFILVERENIDVVLREMEISEKSSLSTSTIVKAGKTISTDYIISGKIEKRKSYIITIKVISVHTGKIINAFTIKSKDEAKLKKDFKKISIKISETLYNKNPKRVFLDYKISYMHMTGKLGNILNPAFGMTFEISRFRNLYKNLYFTGRTGFYYTTGKVNEKDTALLIPLGFSGYYNINFYKDIYFSPVFFAGMETIILHHEKDPGFSNMNENSTEYAVEPVISGGIKFSYFNSNRLQLGLGCEFGTIIEPVENLYFLNFNFGASHLF